MIKPTEIKRITAGDKAGIEITWDSNETKFYSAKFLRENCPCATCDTARGSTSHEKPLSSGGRASLKVLSSSLDEQTRIDQIWAVGNYALGIRWGDKHDSGIYSWKYFSELATEADKQNAEWSAC